MTNGPTASNGSYVASTGFWFSVPTTAPITGTKYVSGSTATLKAGATFSTTVTFTIPASANAEWPGKNVQITGQTWNKALNSTLSHQNASATYLQTAAAAGKWSAAAPTNTKNADGSYTFTGVITFTTTEDVKLTQSGTKYYGQVIIMPATVQMNPAYGWRNFSQTSSVTSATISYSGTGVTGGSLSVPVLTTTSKINP